MENKNQNKMNRWKIPERPKVRTYKFNPKVKSKKLLELIRCKIHKLTKPKDDFKQLFGEITYREKFK